MKNMIDAMQWRYATKVFDADKKLTKEQIDLLLEALRLAPSSFGLQPWRVIVVTDPDVREKLRQAGYGQAQFTDASQVIVFAAKKDLRDSDVDEFITLTARERGGAVSDLSEYAGMMKQFLSGLSTEKRIEWASRQAYLGLGVLLATAAHEGIDACPMEGFDLSAFNEILGLEEKGLTTCVVATVGFRSETDQTALLPKVRFPKEEFIREIE